MFEEKRGDDRCWRFTLYTYIITEPHCSPRSFKELVHTRRNLYCNQLLYSRLVRHTKSPYNTNLPSGRHNIVRFGIRKRRVIRLSVVLVSHIIHKYAFISSYFTVDCTAAHIIYVLYDIITVHLCLRPRLL